MRWFKGLFTPRDVRTKRKFVINPPAKGNFKTENIMYDVVCEMFPSYAIKQSDRTHEWLISRKNARLEMDVSIKELKIAFEFQGAGHRNRNAFGKTDSEFEYDLIRDADKRRLCIENGWFLIELSDFEVYHKDNQVTKSNMKQGISKCLKGRYSEKELKAMTVRITS